MSSLPPSQRSSRTPWKIGLAISALVHLVGILLYGGIDVIPEYTVAPSESSGEVNLQGMRVIDLPLAEEEEEEDPAPEPVEPEPVESQPVPEEPVTTAPSASTPTVAAPTRAETEEAEEQLRAAAERLRDIHRDPLLWTEWSDFSTLDLEETLTADLALEIRAFQDSINAAQARSDSYTDWTWTDGDGGKWGISPGKIHLGSITLPLPIGFAPNAYQRERNAERTFQDEQLQRQYLEGLMLETWKERIAAMRERREKERLTPRSGLGVPPPDTIRHDSGREMLWHR